MEEAIKASWAELLTTLRFQTGDLTAAPSALAWMEGSKQQSADLARDFKSAAVFQ